MSGPTPEMFFDLLLVSVLHDMPDVCGEIPASEHLVPLDASPEQWPTIQQIRRDIRSGKIPVERIEAAFARVTAWYEADAKGKR